MKQLSKVLSLIVATLMLLTACKNNEDPGIPEGYGQVTFELVRKNVYLVQSLKEIKTIKITVSNSEGREITLPSLDVAGTEELVSTRPYALPAGAYKVAHYVCFDSQADIIEELDITPTRDNEFTVTAGQATAMPLPIQVKNVLTTSNLFNSLYGLCMEVLGPDRSTWPKSWDFDGEGVDGDWAGLEFEWDVATNTPTELIGIVIDGNPEYIINSDTGEEILVSLPEFAHMRKLPSCISNFMNLDGLTIRNCDLEELCPELQFSPITSLTIYNTKLASVPEELGNMKNLCDVWLGENRFTEFPEVFTQIKDINAFVMHNEKIHDIPESIANWGKGLWAFEVTGSEITSLPDVFDRLYNISTLVLDDNAKLSSLPASLRLTEIPYDGGEGGNFTYMGITGLSLRGCGFTQIPDEIKRARMHYLDMSYNKLTSVSKADFDAMPDLETLKLDGNHFTSFPALTNPNLSYLSLRGCGLNRSQVDISGLPKLNPAYFFCE